jgi:hypothetical protein
MKLVFLLALVLCGCQRSNPYYCADHPDHNCLLDGSGAVACTAEDQCTEPGRAVCDTSKMPGSCVECTASQTSACVGATPVCSTDDACRGCANHGECASNACLADGSCADEASVAYVSSTGSDTNTCARTQPCAKISHALTATTARFIKVTGTISDNVAINRDITILADQDGTLVAKDFGAVVQIGAPSISVEIDDLTITGANGAGVVLPQAATVVLRRATVSGNSSSGVNASAGSLLLDRTTVRDNGTIGVSAVGLDALTIQRSTIANNHAGGISLQSTPFTIQNNFIYSNGGGSGFGGVSIYQLAPAGPHDLSFDTITGNFGPPATNTGIECLVLSPVPQFANNVVYGNAVSSGGAQVHGTCTFEYSDIGPDGVVSGTNLNVDPMFQLPTDYHIKPTSPLKDAADMNATLMVDIDGDQRPINNRRDIGADESP